jgi:hypothetical protein
VDVADFDIHQVLVGRRLDERDAHEFTAHVVDLCAAADAAWRPDPSASVDRAEGSFDSREFRSPPIVHEIDYFTALHELGHLTLDLPEFQEEQLLLDNEETVWRWALDEALVYPSGEAAGMIYRAIFAKGDPANPAAQRLKSTCEEYSCQPMRRKAAALSAERPGETAQRDDPEPPG